jgi:hypothetical protein
LGEIQPAAWIDALVLVSVAGGRSGVDPGLLLTLLLFSASHFGTKSADGKRDTKDQLFTGFNLNGRCHGACRILDLG